MPAPKVAARHWTWKGRGRGLVFSDTPPTPMGQMREVRTYIREKRCIRVGILCASKDDVAALNRVRPSAADTAPLRVAVVRRRPRAPPASLRIAPRHRVPRLPLLGIA